MRALGYPRPVSMENFRSPNFPLVADILYWLVQRYDPLVSISDNIETEDDRVEFVMSVVQTMASRARVHLKPKHVAMRKNEAARDGQSTVEEEQDHSAALSARLQDLSSLRDVSREITERGAKLHDLLQAEHDLRQDREKALRFLGAVSGSDGRAAQEHMERSVRDAIQAVQDNVASLEQQCRELETEKKQLTSRKDKVTSELERNNRQLQNLQNVRPAFMDEYERLEQELSEEYDMYIQKFRNLDYLERELDRLNQREKAKMEASNRALRRLQRKLREEELKHFRGDEHVDESALQARPQAAGGARPGAAARPPSSAGRRPGTRGREGGQVSAMVGRMDAGDASGGSSEGSGEDDSLMDSGSLGSGSASGEEEGGEPEGSGMGSSWMDDSDEGSDADF